MGRQPTTWAIGPRRKGCRPGRPVRPRCSQRPGPRTGTTGTGRPRSVTRSRRSRRPHSTQVRAPRRTTPMTRRGRRPDWGPMRRRRHSPALRGRPRMPARRAGRGPPTARSRAGVRRRRMDPAPAGRDGRTERGSAEGRRRRRRDGLLRPRRHRLHGAVRGRTGTRPRSPLPTGSSPTTSGWRTCAAAIPIRSRSGRSSSRSGRSSSRRDLRTGQRRTSPPRRRRRGRTRPRPSRRPPPVHSGRLAPRVRPIPLRHKRSSRRRSGTGSVRC